MGPKVSAATGIGGTGTAFVTAATLDVKAAAVVAPAYFGLTAIEWQILGIAGSLLFGFVGVACTVWFGWRRDQREERAREQRA
jgi:hypothetical protein